jgi:hypothetical protein
MGEYGRAGPEPQQSHCPTGRHALTSKTHTLFDWSR